MQSWEPVKENGEQKTTTEQRMKDQQWLQPTTDLQNLPNISHHQTEEETNKFTKENQGRRGNSSRSYVLEGLPNWNRVFIIPWVVQDTQNRGPHQAHSVQQGENNKWCRKTACQNVETTGRHVPALYPEYQGLCADQQYHTTWKWMYKLIWCQGNLHISTCRSCYKNNER